MFEIPENLLVKLNDVKTNILNVLFVLPGIEGNCDAFKDLSEKLESFSIQVYGLAYSKHVPNDSIESSAKLFLNEMKNELKRIKHNSCILAGYSFGGIIAIEILRQYEMNTPDYVFISHLILFESSHKFFRVGVHVNAKVFGNRIPNKDIFKRNYIYTGSLSIYLSYMIGRPDLKFEIFNRLKESVNLEDALERAFKYVETFHKFENELELNEMKSYLKILLLKSNAGLIYDFDSNCKLFTPISLFKTTQFMYKKGLDDLRIKEDYESNNEFKFDFNTSNYNLNEISVNFSIYECKRGNHWTFISENSNEISNFIYKISYLSDSFRSKL